MSTNNQSPVTASAEQATTYAVAKENEINNNLKANQEMDAETTNQISVNPPVSECQSLQDGCPVPLKQRLCGTYLAGTRAGTTTANPHLTAWNGEPLKEDVVYHRNAMLGLPECSIMENRDAQKRAKGWKKTCRENGMTNSALYVSAKTVKEAGLTPAIYQRDTKSWWIVPEDLLHLFYTRWDGNGRGAGHDLDLDQAMNDPSHSPFDFSFVYKVFESPEQFFKQYISTNLEVKKTMRSEMLRYTSCRNAGGIFNSYYALQNDGFVAKAASLYIFGRELTKDDIKKASNGEAISVDQGLVDSMGNLLHNFKEVFKSKHSQKVLKGVPLARWTCHKLKNATDMKAMAEKINDSFSKMPSPLLGRLQDAKGVRGDRARTTEIILTEIFDEVLNN